MGKLKWVDVMKGIGILAVVLGHLVSGVSGHLIYLFHMPLFFFLSGYLFRPRTDLSEYFKKKTIHLILPYVCFLIPIYLAFNSIDFAKASQNDVLMYFVNPIFGGPRLSGALTVFWFVTCLFLVQQIMNYLIIKFDVRKVRILILTFMILGYVNSMLFPGAIFPWSANVVLMAAPIFYLGYEFKLRNFEFKTAFLIFLGLLSIVISLYVTNDTLDMKKAFYGVPLVTVLSSIVIILNIKELSIYLAKHILISNVFIKIGKASMTIMFLHQPIQILIQRYISSNISLKFIGALFISFCFHLLFEKFELTRVLFLGSYKDYPILKQKFFLF